MTDGEQQRREHGSAGPHAAGGRETAREKISRRFEHIANTVVVLSGKGGVGKSTVAVNLALALTRHGMRVGLLDADLHGPSVPQLLGLEGRRVTGREGAIVPVAHGDGLVVMSVRYFLPDDGQAVIWRGPLKQSFIEQLLGDTEWGELDYLVVDLPPGTGDEPLAMAQLIPDARGALVVTTPQDVALADVRRSITFCRQLGMPVIGIVENMGRLVCPHCGEVIDVFAGPGGAALA